MNEGNGPCANGQQQGRVSQASTLPHRYLEKIKIERIWKYININIKN
jgi:hypothetical protein